MSALVDDAKGVVIAEAGHRIVTGAVGIPGAGAVGVEFSSVDAVAFSSSFPPRCVSGFAIFKRKYTDGHYTQNRLKINTNTAMFKLHKPMPMSNAELQSGSEGVFEVSESPVLSGREAVSQTTDSKKVSAPRWGARMAALAVLLSAASCGSDRSYGNNGTAPVKADRSESAETPKQTAQIQLQLNGGRKAGVSLFYAENKFYDFRLTSVADPQDVIKIGSNGEKVELLEGEFQNPTNGYKVEAFDKEGNTVEIGLSGGAAIYGPDRF